MLLNNVCLGVYGEAVRQQAYRDAKLRTLIETTNAVRTATTERASLSIKDDRGREHTEPAVVIVSNNPYAIGTPRRGARPALDGGRLGIIVIDASGSGPSGPGSVWTAPNLEIQTHGSVRAGLDGEAVDLNPPLRFTVRPAALRVRISRAHADAVR
jgi:diacylglycerol kinase family enzyme